MYLAFITMAVTVKGPLSKDSAPHPNGAYVLGGNNNCWPWYSRKCLPDVSRKSYSCHILQCFLQKTLAYMWSNAYHKVWISHWVVNWTQILGMSLAKVKTLFHPNGNCRKDFSTCLVLPLKQLSIFLETVTQCNWQETLRACSLHLFM